MGLTDLTLGWYEDASGLVITPPGRDALEQYIERLGALTGSARPRTSMIHGWKFSPAAVVADTADIQDAVRVLAAALLQHRECPDDILGASSERVSTGQGDKPSCLQKLAE
jgi:hypothetical protein